jgi:hypothetical protein
MRSLAKRPSKNPITVATPSANAELIANEKARFAEKRRKPIAKAVENESRLKTTAKRIISQVIIESIANRILLRLPLRSLEDIAEVKPGWCKSC